MNESSGFRLLDPPEGHQSPPHIQAPRAAYSSLRGRRAAGVPSFLPSNARRRRRPRSQPGHLGCSLRTPGLVGVSPGAGSYQWGQKRHPAGGGLRRGAAPARDEALGTPPCRHRRRLRPRKSLLEIPGTFFHFFGTAGVQRWLLSSGLNVLGLVKSRPAVGGGGAGSWSRGRRPAPVRSTQSGFHRWEQSAQGCGQAGGTRFGVRTGAFCSQPGSQRQAGAAGLVGAAVQPARGARQAALLLWLRPPKGRGPSAGWICPQPRREPSSPRAESRQPAGGSSPGRPAALPAPSAASPVLAERTGWGSVSVGVASNCVCETTSLHLSTFPGCAVALSPQLPFAATQRAGQRPLGRPSPPEPGWARRCPPPSRSSG